MTMQTRTLVNRATRLLPFALLLAAPAVLLLSASIICTVGDCRPGPLDTAGMLLAARGHAPLLDTFFRAITWAGSILVLGPLALAHAAFMWHRLRLRALYVPGALAGAVLMAYATKILVARARPDVAALIDMPADASFPSAHSLQVSAFVSAWLLAPARDAGRPRAGEIALGILLVALVAWSRLHLQVHFPSDILCAIAAGTIWAVAFRQLPMWSPRP